MSRKLIDLQGLAEFKRKCDETYSGGGFEIPTFTPTTFEIELPDVDITLSSQDCADIIENEYPIITISLAFSEEETVSLTFARNNTFSGMEKGQPYTNLQYDILIDDDEDAYIVGLSFSDNDMKSWCMKITSEGTHILTLSSMTGTLDSADLEYALSNNCVIDFSGQRYYKEMDTQILRYHAFPRTGVSGIIIEYIDINKSTGYFEHHVETQMFNLSESDLGNQSILLEIYENAPQIIRVSSSTDGIQFYKIDNDHRVATNILYYSCLLFGALIELKFIDTNGTISFEVTRYQLTPINT